ncbi:2Fe-2S iron-sulfur cluster-binding protein [Dasania marina]|uniref:2Fe-2S iron-sulfur cluster-binding protein n=1 Tax=Dasania marina TaxID=471499 RepID=UPI0003615EFB|nr:2Fe-2S iron-sulfur cluster-binding protein [Dasania marina]
MPIIKYIDADGNTIEVDVPEGTTLMQAAVDNMIPSILGECGGGCSCGTCHCFIEEGRIAELPEPDAIEQSLLNMITDTKPNSRLGCQISMNDSLSGLVVHLPKEQQF